MSDHISTKIGPIFSSGPIPTADENQPLHLRFDPRTHKSECHLSFPSFTVGESRHFFVRDTHMREGNLERAVLIAEFALKNSVLSRCRSEVRICTANNSDAWIAYRVLANAGSIRRAYQSL